MARPIAVLDANVLYPARLRDLFLRLAIDGQFSARWTDQILDETFSNLIEDRPDLAASALQRTRDLMTTALPDAMVTGYEVHIERSALPDPDDRHVLAAAITTGADVIVTANLVDFPPHALPSTIEAIGPDAFVTSLIEADIDAVVSVVEAQAASLRLPPMTVNELLDGLAEVHLDRSVVLLRDAFI